MTQATTTRTAGQTFTARLNRLARIDQDTPLCRQVRGRRKDRPMESVVDRAMEIVTNAVTRSGPAYTARSADELRPGWAAVCGWRKHVNGYRLNTLQVVYLKGLTPWEVTAMLGAMVDAGVGCTGDAERWFADHRDEHLEAARAKDAAR